jgi:hypothetical protein
MKVKFSRALKQEKKKLVLNYIFFAGLDQTVLDQNVFMD